jgi:thiamine-monophosphate kinase
MLEDTPQDLTPISKLGEFGLIERLTRDFKIRDNAVLKGVGDDAAVYSVSATEVHVVTTDLLVEGVHFDLRYVPMQHLGYKAVAVNLSDVYAMNARPFGITVSVGLSNRFTVEAMEAFYEGVRAACKNYNVDLLGGDTSSSLTGMLISVTAIGRAAKDDVVYRSGAKIHDLICVSGDLGAAFAGLQLLEREKSVFLKNPDIQPDLSGFD